MTIIVAKKYKDKIVVASDKQVTHDWHMKSPFSKIIKIDNMIIGGAGAGAGCQMMQLFCLENKLKSCGETDVLMFFKKFISYATEFDKEYRKDSNDWLIAFNEEILKVSSGVFIYKDLEVASIGSGSEIALGAVHAGFEPVEAVRLASKLTVYCGEGVDSYEIEVKNE